MLPLANKLVARGHDVHFLETSYYSNPFKFPAGITNHFVTLPNDGSFEKQFLKGMWTMTLQPHMIAALFVAGDQAFAETYDEHYDAIRPLLNITWDMVVADELFSMGAYALSQYHYEQKQTPMVILSTSCILQPFTWIQALGRPAYSRPSMWFPYGENLYYEVDQIGMRGKAALDEFISGVAIFYEMENFHLESFNRLGLKEFNSQSLESSVVQFARGHYANDFPSCSILRCG
ncbi:hypothetical protein L596_030097 [Steinernema carpocapsae]|uniref:Uncharacterized protein n=1 Tax=Steinernema carpocapsae TaxID=34508 RepID=A0A4U5LRQ2_STECR|nr:hypothetical protein L596_030097 [Steinernema carpocapsae]